MCAYVVSMTRDLIDRQPDTMEHAEYEIKNQQVCIVHILGLERNITKYNRLQLTIVCPSG